MPTESCRPFDRPLDAEQLLEHAGWMRVLARSLVQDDSRADDIVQQAWLAAVEHPPRDRAAVGGWLARVVRNLAGRAHRDDRRRERREQVAARPERIDFTAGDLLERAEVHRMVVDAVIALDEPFRSIILLRFFEGLPPREIARLKGVPEGTVRWRLACALRKLRSRLDRCHGGRDAWLLLVLPLAGWEASSTVVAAVAAPIASKSAVPWIILGGIAMTQKMFLAIAAAGLFILALGFGIGRVTAPGPDGDTAARRAHVPKEVADDLRAKHARALAEIEEWKSRLAAKDRELAQVTARAATPAGPATEAGKGLATAAELDADWSSFAKQVKMSAEAVVRSRKGSKLTPEEEAMLTALRAEYSKLASNLRLKDKDPLFKLETVRAFARSFYGMGLGLSEEQLQEIDRKTEAAFLDLAPSEEDLEQMRPLEKYALRQKLVSEIAGSVGSVLTPEQEELMTPLRSYADGLLQGNRKVDFIGLKEDALSKIQSSLEHMYGLTDGQVPGLAGLASEYLDGVKDILARHPGAGETLGLPPLGMGGNTSTGNMGFASPPAVGQAPPTPGTRLGSSNSEEKRALEAEFLNLQMGFEDRILPNLTPKQLEDLWASLPRLLQFNDQAINASLMAKGDGL